jgi:hypothetical protein
MVGLPSTAAEAEAGKTEIVENTTSVFVATPVCVVVVVELAALKVLGDRVGRRVNQLEYGSV